MSLQDYTLSFENTLGMSADWHFQILIYRDATLDCIVGQTNTTEEPSLLSADPQADVFPLTLASGETTTITVNSDSFIDQALFENYDALTIVWQVRTSDSDDWDSYSTTENVIVKANITEKTECLLFDFFPNRATPMTYHPQMVNDLIDLGWSAPSRDTNNTAPNPMIIEAEYLLLDETDLAEFEAFFDARWGDVQSFCVPSWQSDFIVSSAASSGASSVTVTDGDAEVAAGDTLFFCLKDGSNSYFTRTVDTVTDNGTTLDISFTSNIPVDVPENAMVSKVYRVYFAESDLTFNFVTNDKARITVRFIEEIRDTLTTECDL